MDLAFYTIVIGLFAGWLGWTDLSVEEVQIKLLALLVVGSVLLHLHRWLF